ncbi:MAG: hypothetical protein LBJ14_00805 [Desulfarculales bacterium]|nr:hypothetical protein [Desulfarculales bacterium]
MPKIAVKFCGGCNPAYDRGEIVARLRREYPEAAVTFISQDESWPQSDLCLIITGCRESCLDYSPYLGRQGRIVISSPDDFQKIAVFMNERPANTGACGAEPDTAP